MADAEQLKKQNEKVPLNVPESTKEYQEIIDQFKVTLNLAKIGEHFLNFIVRCRKMGAPPLTVLQILREIKNEPKNIDKHKTIIPILCFADWLNDPSEENFQNLQKSIGVKVDKIVENELKNAGKQENQMSTTPA